MKLNPKTLFLKIGRNYFAALAYLATLLFNLYVGFLCVSGLVSSFSLFSIITTILVLAALAAWDIGIIFLHISIIKYDR